MANLQSPTGTLSPRDREILITLDTDWAPDWVIEEAAGLLLQQQVRATWFVTNDGAATQALRRESLFEVGLHPNFLPGSTHGDTLDAVMSHMKTIVPEAISVRSHALCQAEPWLQAMVERHGIRHDCSIHLPLQHGIVPHRIRLSPDAPPLVRLPHVFQDNMFMFAQLPWSLEQPWFESPGLKVFCFHPIHIVMNAAGMTHYEGMKQRSPIPALRPDDVPRRGRGEGGCLDLFLDLLRCAREEHCDTVTGFVSHWLAVEAERRCAPGRTS